jgi:hypothetical protein
MIFAGYNLHTICLANRVFGTMQVSKPTGNRNYFASMVVSTAHLHWAQAQVCAQPPDFIHEQNK